MQVLETRALARTNQNEHPPSGGWVEEQLNELMKATSQMPQLHPSAWAGSGFEERVLALRRFVDRYRHNASKQILGPAQLQWIQDLTSTSSHQYFPQTMLAVIV